MGCLVSLQFFFGWDGRDADVGRMVTMRGGFERLVADPGFGDGIVEGVWGSWRGFVGVSCIALFPYILSI